MSKELVQLNSIVELSSVLNSELELETIFEVLKMTYTGNFLTKTADHVLLGRTEQTNPKGSAETGAEYLVNPSEENRLFSAFKSDTPVRFTAIKDQEIREIIQKLSEEEPDLVCPLFSKRQLVGLSILGPKITEEIYTDEELGLIKHIGSAAGVAINNARLFQELSDLNETLEQKVVERTAQLEEAKNEAEEERHKADELLVNILPGQVAKELKAHGHYEPKFFDSATVVFTDFEGFTSIAESMSPGELVAELDKCFSYFDSLVGRFNLEKLKTIGDSYMCAGGIPQKNNTHAIDAVLAALEIQAFMDQMREIKEGKGLPFWMLRVGINTGPVVGGVIGEKRFIFDIWGDTVNTASRMESAGITGKINVSETTYERIKDFFECTPRGKVAAKNKGELDMYLVDGILPGLAEDSARRRPNNDFKEKYKALQAAGFSL